MALKHPRSSDVFLADGVCHVWPELCSVGSSAIRDAAVPCALGARSVTRHSTATVAVAAAEVGLRAAVLILGSVSCLRTLCHQCRHWLPLHVRSQLCKGSRMRQRRINIYTSSRVVLHRGLHRSWPDCLLACLADSITASLSKLLKMDRFAGVPSCSNTQLIISSRTRAPNLRHSRLAPLLVQMCCL